MLFKSILLITCISLLTACGIIKDAFRPSGIGTGKYEPLRDARGDGVGSCDYPSYSMAKEDGYNYLRAFGLPTEIEGNFICTADKKPALPKDCNGKEFRSEQELRAYWEKYQLPVGLIHFHCNKGVPSVRPHAIPFWKEVERVLGPTCKDANGKPRYCI